MTATLPLVLVLSTLKIKSDLKGSSDRGMEIRDDTTSEQAGQNTSIRKCKSLGAGGKEQCIWAPNPLKCLPRIYNLMKPHRLVILIV